MEEYVMKLEEEYWRLREKIEGHITTSGLRYFERWWCGGDRIGKSRIQYLSIQKAFKVLEEDVWLYGYKSKNWNNRSKELLEEVRRACGYTTLNYQAFWHWLQHYIQYWQTPAETGSRCGEKIRK